MLSEMYAEANDCQGILILLIRLGRLRRATTKHRIHLFSLSRTDPHRCNEPPVNLFASENEQREQRARTFNESEDRKFSGKCLILNEDREVGEWRKSTVSEIFFYANELVIVTIWKVGHEGYTNVFLSRIKIFERECEYQSI